MVTYIATLFAKVGSEDEVAKFYQDMEPQMSTAQGFKGRQIMRAKPGTMFSIVKNYLSEEDLARASEAPHAEGVHFVMIEKWETAEDRVKFSRSQDKSRAASLYPHLLPQHTHEFYEDITP